MGIVNKRLGKRSYQPAELVYRMTLYNVAQGLDDLEHMRGTRAGEIMRIKLAYPGISDDLIRRIMADDNPLRKAEVFATMDEDFKMQEKGMKPESIIEDFKESWKSKAGASGGLARILEV